MVTTCSAQADEICGTAGRPSAVGRHVKLICPVDQWSQIFMSFCAGDTQGLSETSKQFPEGVGEAEAGSLNVLSGQRWGRLTASGQQGGVLCWVTEDCSWGNTAWAGPSCPPTAGDNSTVTSRA